MGTIALSRNFNGDCRWTEPLLKPQEKGFARWSVELQKQTAYRWSAGSPRASID
jgi:hypothetical protein